jgi:primosomal protein N' (replication factor Y)
VVVGARSAVFAPVEPLGVLVVDEEQEGAFKQEDGVRYHARDVGLVRAQRAGAVCLLGSATPSLESWARATGRVEGASPLGYLRLPERVEARPMPTVEVVDLRRTLEAQPPEAQPAKRSGGPTPPPPVGPALEAALEATLAAGQQALLFLNRRGYATFLLCPDCGRRFTCEACAVALVYHRAERALRCHYCGASRPAPAVCPACAGQDVLQFGSGTERVEAWLAARFPRARRARLDRDAVGPRGAVRDVLARVAAGEVDVLIGTQMVAKGHDFPGVTLVGVLLAESGLSLPDFRAAERTFQLVTQVAGRAGRGEAPGRVVVQTYDPEHPAVRLAAAGALDAFYETELAARRELGYPPFRRLVNVRIEATSGDAARRAAGWAAARASARLAEDAALAGLVEAIGPGSAAGTAGTSSSRGGPARPCGASPPTWPGRPLAGGASPRGRRWPWTWTRPRCSDRPDRPPRGEPSTGSREPTDARQGAPTRYIGTLESTRIIRSRGAGSRPRSPTASARCRPSAGHGERRP